MKNYICPSKKAPQVFREVLSEHNTLIAGAVGSGKTTFENGLIYSLINSTAPGAAQIYLIDPKQFELRHFMKLPHCSGYADTPEGALEILDTVERIREARSDWMKHHGMRKWSGGVVYLFIDELADLMTGDKKYAKEFCEKLVKIMQLGRALNIKVIALTQQPRREVTPARLQVNFTCNVALHCRSAIESRQIIGIPGAELLPRYGECYVSSAGYVEKKSVPYITDGVMNAMIDYWTSEKCLTGDTGVIESSYKNGGNEMTIYGRTITQEDMNNIASYMDDEIRERLHSELMTDSPEEFLEAYLEEDPDFEDLLRTEFDFRR